MPASDHSVPLPSNPAPVYRRKSRFHLSGARVRRWASVLGGVALAAAALRIQARRRAALANG
jgi:hypothetical protein